MAGLDSLARIETPMTAAKLRNPTVAPSLGRGSEPVERYVVIFVLRSPRAGRWIKTG